MTSTTEFRTRHAAALPPPTPATPTPSANSCQDEYDPAARASPIVGETMELDGLLHRDDVHERAGISLPDGPFETPAGFVQTQLGRIPSTGDSLHAFGHRFTVLEVDG